MACLQIPFVVSYRFLRPLKSYQAPSNVAEKVQSICATLQISNKPDYSLKNLEEKFKFLQACFKDFQHSVPNSQVHELKTVGKLRALFPFCVYINLSMNSFPIR